MAQTRPSKDILDKLKQRRGWILKQIARCRVFEEGGKTEFWQTVKGMAKEKLDQIDENLENYDRILAEKSEPFPKIVALLEAKRQQKFFMSLVDDFNANKEGFEKSLFECDQEIKEYTKKLNDYEG